MTVVTPKFGMGASVLWRAYGIRHVEMPATPARIWAAIRDASPK